VAFLAVTTRAPDLCDTPDRSRFMTITLASRIIALVVAGLLSAPMAALAQSAKTPAQAPSAPAVPAPGAGKAAPGGAPARIEANIKELHAQLKITPVQEAQWEQFAQVMRENARDMEQVATQRAQQSAPMNAVQDMQSMEKIAEAQVQHLQKLIPAFQNLYAAMSPEQKARADGIFRTRPEGPEQTGSGRSR